MKAFIKSIFLFFLLVIGFLVGVNEFQRFYNNDPKHFRLQYKEVQSGAKSYEGIIIGSSHSTHSIVPSILDKSGLHFFNFALDGSNPKFYYKWYNLVFLKHKNNPKYCIIGIDWFLFDEKSLERKFEQDAEYFEDGLFNNLLSEAACDKKELILNRFPVFKYRTSILASLVLTKGDKSFPLKGYNRGYIPYKTPFDSTRFKPKVDIKVDIKIDSMQLMYFKKLITQLREKKVNIIFVMTPEYGISNLEYEKMRSIDIINNMSKELNIPFLNFNTLLRSDFNENIQYFSDWGHLNEYGSMVFSNKLSYEIDRLIKARTHNMGFLCYWGLTNNLQLKAKPVFSFSRTSTFEHFYKQ